MRLNSSILLLNSILKQILIVINNYDLFTLQIDEVFGGFLSLGDTITRYMSHIYILMGMSDGMSVRPRVELRFICAEVSPSRSILAGISEGPKLYEYRECFKDVKVEKACVPHVSRHEESESRPDEWASPRVRRQSLGTARASSRAAAALLTNSALT